MIAIINRLALRLAIIVLFHNKWNEGGGGISLKQSSAMPPWSMMIKLQVLSNGLTHFRLDRHHHVRFQDFPVSVWKILGISLFN